MMIFVVYAALVWYAAGKWRRRWPAFVIVTFSVLLVAGIIRWHHAFAEWTGLTLVSSMVHGLLKPYIVLLALIGYYISILPRPLGEGAAHPCHECGYDLIGMEEFEHPHCPECGLEIAPRDRPPRASPANRALEAPTFSPDAPPRRRKELPEHLRPRR